MPSFSMIHTRHLYFAKIRVIRKLEVTDECSPWWRLILNTAITVIAIISKDVIFRWTQRACPPLKREYVIIIRNWGHNLCFTIWFRSWLVICVDIKFLSVYILSFIGDVNHLQIVIRRVLHGHVNHTIVFTLHWAVL